LLAILGTLHHRRRYAKLGREKVGRAFRILLGPYAHFDQGGDQWGKHFGMSAQEILSREVVFPMSVKARPQ
jgi:hypothetical protein